MSDRIGPLRHRFRPVYCAHPFGKEIPIIDKDPTNYGRYDTVMLHCPVCDVWVRKGDMPPLIQIGEVDIGDLSFR